MLQSGPYKIQNLGNCQWVGLGAVPASDPPPPVALKGLQEMMKGRFEVSHQGGSSYHIFISGMDESELRSRADTTTLMPFTSRQLWIIETTGAGDSYLIKDQELNAYWTLLDGSGSWYTPIQLQQKNGLPSQEWKFTTSKLKRVVRV